MILGGGQLRRVKLSSVTKIPGCKTGPPSAPAGGSSDWDGSSKTGGTIVSYSCPDSTIHMKAVCDPATLTWTPADIPAC